MKDQLIADLSSKLPNSLAEDLVTSYQELTESHRSGAPDQALYKGGRFVEHVFRAIEHIRTGTTPAEIKSVHKTMKNIENDTTLDESLRLLIPRAAYGMIYNVRSKKNAVHVKVIDPTPIDAALLVSAASWIMAEFIRLYHASDLEATQQLMMALTRTSIPLIETIADETFVNKSVPAEIEVLLHLAHAKPAGLSRTLMGKAAKCSAPSVSTALKSLKNERLVHVVQSGEYHITSTGEHKLSEWLLSNPTK